MSKPRQYLKTAELAKHWKLTPRTLENWRNDGIGPPFVRFNGRVVRYDLDACERWLAEQPTTRGGAA